MHGKFSFAVFFLIVLLGCGQRDQHPQTKKDTPPVPILLITLDTTRYDALMSGEDLPHLKALLADGVGYTAFTTAPQTLPAHASILTGRYPHEHGVHQNARVLSADQPLLSDQLKRHGYTTAAFVSGAPLAPEFGLSRGFDRYDAPSERERRADVTTDKALAFLDGFQGARLFMWVHYFDPHHPYDPPEPFKTRFADNPYLGEIAFMDQHLGRLTDAFRRRFEGQPFRIAVLGDHGEGLGEHGENYHGNLIYNSVMKVPFILHPKRGLPPAEGKVVSIRTIYHFLLNETGVMPNNVFQTREVVLGEAMKPYLQYGWRPQIMAVDAAGTTKRIGAGDWERYNLVDDPGELNNLAEGDVGVDAGDRALIAAVNQYPVPNTDSAAAAMDPEQVQQLASLGYSASATIFAEKGDRPAPRSMTHLFDDLDRASDLFVREDYAASLSIYSRLLEADPQNPTLHLRQAVAYSVLGDEADALEHFKQAGYLSPNAVDLRHFLGMHYLRFNQMEEAAKAFTFVLARQPQKLPAIAALARIREGQGRVEEAASLYERAVALKPDHSGYQLKLAELSMAGRQTESAIRAFEAARRLLGDAFSHHLELGVCYLAVGRNRESADCFDLVSDAHPGYPMALFKRAQVSVLLDEPDAAERIRAAEYAANNVTARLIREEKLFAPYR